MRYLKPDFYDEFSCLAGACPKTCCAGWQIVIDETSLDKYEGLSGLFGNRIRNSIDWEEEIFFQYGSRCAFLNEEDLCEIQKELGESYLCDTCKMYPRHVEEYEGLREYSLSLSCPKAAEMILENQKKVTFSEWETEEEEEFEAFDFLMFTQLEDARDILYTIIQNRDLNFEKRAWMCAELAKAMQEAVDENQFFEIDALLEQYRNQDIKLLCKKYKIEAPHARYARMKREIRVLQEELEHLESAWSVTLENLAELLYQDGEENYCRIYEEFQKGVGAKSDKKQEWEIQKEQLMMFFVYTYFCGAVYDDAIWSKMALSLFSVEWITELWMYQWISEKKTLTFENKVELAYRYAREIEHSDLNLERLENYFTADKHFV